MATRLPFQSGRAQRHRRIRAQVRGTSARPRLSVFRSAKHIVVQVIDDESGRTLAAVSDRDVASTTSSDRSRAIGIAFAAGAAIAERTKAVGVSHVVFDRGGYAYHGRVAAVAEGAREGGLIF
jgi:large subunit ribosomal protein L18